MKSIEEIIELLNKQFSNRVIEWDDISEFAHKHHLRFDAGETRYCIFSPKWDRVLKIPRFENVNDDYSALEVRNYEYAKELGLDKILLPTGLLTTLDSGCPIYWQTKFSYSHSNMDYHEEIHLKKQFEQYFRSPIYLKVKRTMPDDRRYNDVWLFRAYQLYGKQFFKKLCLFFEENEIKDLHSNNVGWLKGKPIILDYAGYHENDW
jgi:hypothetical protein